MRRLLPATLTGRVVTTTVLLVAAVGICVSALATVTLRSYLTDRLDGQLQESTDRAAREIDRFPGGLVPPGGATGGVPVPLGQGTGTLTAVLGPGTSVGAVVGDGEQIALSRTVLAALADEAEVGEVVALDLPGLGEYRVLAVEAGSGTTLVNGLPTDEVDRTVARQLGWVVALTLTGIVLAGLVGHVVVRRQLRPLRSIAETAHEVATLPLSTGAVGPLARVPDVLSDPTTEVGTVGEALNVMLSHVEGALDERHRNEQQARRFLADASHELRTPLATIAGYAELVRRADETDPERLRHALSKVESESARMSTLVADMLLLARLDAGRPLAREQVDVTRLVVEAVDDARVVTPDHRWSFDVPDEPLVVTGDAGRLHQVLTNLLTNAARHTGPGTSVAVRLRGDAETVTLEIADDGPGISPDLLPTLFDRFTRGDGSRTRASGGAGLGTSLVRAITEAHGGHVEVESRPGRTCFTVTLPA